MCDGNRADGKVAGVKTEACAAISVNDLALFDSLSSRLSCLLLVCFYCDIEQY